MTLVSSSASGSRPDTRPGHGSRAPVRPSRFSRRARALLVAAEVVVAAVVGGVVVRGALGWVVVALAALAAVLIVAGARRSWLNDTTAPGAAPEDLLPRLRVVGEVSRSTGEVGVIGDGQGYAAGLELDASEGALVDFALLGRLAAGDPSRPSALQVRVTSYSPPAPRVGVLRAKNQSGVAVHRRLHVLLRLDPVWVSDVVDRHGGGARGARAALVAAVERLSAQLRRDGTANRVMDTGALGALLAEDTDADLPSRSYLADPESSGDLRRLLNVLQRTAPERSILSICVDLAGSDQRRSRTTVLVGSRDAEQADIVQTALLADPAVAQMAPPEALAMTLPLAGGPGRLGSVLTLARS